MPSQNCQLPRPGLEDACMATNGTGKSCLGACHLPIFQHLIQVSPPSDSHPPTRCGRCSVSGLHPLPFSVLLQPWSQAGCSVHGVTE